MAILDLNSVATCCRCNQTKVNGNRYYDHTTCKACYMKDWRKNNPEAAHAIDKRRYSAKRAADWRAKNPERLREHRQRNYHKNKAKFYASNAKRKADKLRQTPAWADLQAIRKIYENCPEGHHVDHIVPLRGKTVRGLHVEYNLQYLLASDNIRKNNRF